MSRQPPGQLDLFAEQEAADEAARAAERERKAANAPSLFNSPARGMAARAAEFQAWRDEYGNFGSYIRSHAFEPVIPAPLERPGRCQPWVLSAHAPDDWTGGPGLAYIAVCRVCDEWEGPVRGDENTAVEDGLDHSWPGWRDLPVVEHKPFGDKQVAMWLKAVKQVYPPGWIEACGPIRTWRTGLGTRSHHAYEWGGYDVGVLAPEAGDES